MDDATRRPVREQYQWAVDTIASLNPDQRELWDSLREADEHDQEELRKVILIFKRKNEKLVALLKKHGIDPRETL